jgi:sugar/nucleoside kinase (ribokinase family)
MPSVDYVVYGKIIIDEIHLANGQRIRAKLGGGGPQAAFGARLWSESVGLLSRSGTDLGEPWLKTLRGLGADLRGWQRYTDIPTPRCVIRYDSEEGRTEARLTTSQGDWDRLLAQDLWLPHDYRGAKAIHLVTEFPDEQAVKVGQDLRASGWVLSLEPLIDSVAGGNQEEMLALLQSVDVVTPDWAAATAFAESGDPKTVVERWSRLGPKLVAVRRGRHGSYVWDAARARVLHVPALPVRVADPTGAGNAYGGGLCVGWVESQNAGIAACRATAAAAVLIRRRGMAPMSTRLRQEARDMVDRIRPDVRPL